MKRFLGITLIFMMVLSLFPAGLFAAESTVEGMEQTVKFTIGEKSYSVGSTRVATDVAPYIKDGRTMVPVAFVAPALGTDKAVWLAESQTVRITRGADLILIKIGSKELNVNGKILLMDTAAELKNVGDGGGRTMLPISFIAKALEIGYQWDGTTSSVNFFGYSKVYDQKGNYGPKAGTLTIEGNAVVKADGVTLQNIIVKGNLIIAKEVGEGSVTLDNITVGGETFIRGGGIHSVKITGNSHMQNVTIARVGGEVRVYAEDGTQIGEVNVDGNDDVIIEGNFGTVTIVASDITVIATNADIVQAAIVGDRSTLKVNDKSTIDTATIEGEDAHVITQSGTYVDNIIANGEGAIISGTGSVSTVEAKADSIKVTTPGTKVSAASSMTGVIAGTIPVKPGGTEVVGGQTGSGSSKGQTGGGGGGGGDGDGGGSNTHPEVTNISLAVTAGLQVGNSNVAANAEIGTLSTTGGTAAFTYALTADGGTPANSADNSSFAIVANKLKVASGGALAVAKDYKVTVKVTDSKGKTYTKGFTITVAAADPEVTNISLAVTEDLQVGNANVAANAEIGTLSTTGGTAAFTYELIADSGTPANSADNSSFAIAANKLKVAAGGALAAAKDYKVTVKVTDSKGKTYTKGFTITVAAADPEVTNISLAATEDLQVGNANVAANAEIGTLSTTGGTAAFTYELIADSGTPANSADNSSFVIAANKLNVASGGALAAAKDYKVTVKVTDSKGKTYTKGFTVTVAAADPEVTNISLAVTEDLQVGNSNVAANAEIGTLSTTGGTAAFTYELIADSGTPANSADNSSFVIAANKLNVASGGALAAAKDYKVTVKVTDSKGKTYTKGFTVTVAAADPEVTNISLAVTEDLQVGNSNVAANAEIGTLSTTGGTADFTYELVADGGTPANSADNSSFVIAANKLNVASGGALAAAKDYKVTVKVTDSKGKTYTKGFTVTVAAADPEVTNISLAVTEDLQVGNSNVAANAEIGTLSTTGGTADFTYELVADGGTPANSADNSSFVIAANKLNVASGGALAAAKDYKVTVKVTDSKGKTYTTGFTITVAAANPAEPVSVSGTSIYANGNAIILDAGTTENYTVVYLDTNSDGIIDDGEAIQEIAGATGSSDITGYDLHSYNVYGGGNSTLDSDTKITMLGGKAYVIYGGGDGGDVTGSTHITVSGGNLAAIVGGGIDCDVSDSTNVAVSGGTIGNIYGGGERTNVATGSTNVTVSGGTINYVYGGGFISGAGTNVTGSTNVTVIGGTVINLICGGGYAATISGDTNVTVSGGNIDGHIYGDSSNGGLVTGTKKIKISGGSIIGTVSGYTVGNLTTEDGTTTVYKTTLTLSGISAVTDVSDGSLTLGGAAGSDYGLADVRTTAGGVLVFYLPAGEATAAYGSDNYTATVTDPGPNFFEIASTTYEITLGTITRVDGDSDSTVTIDETPVEEGATVTLTIEPKAGMRLKEGTLKASYNDGEDKEVALSGSGPYTFTMPAYAVSITAEFEVIPVQSEAPVITTIVLNNVNPQSVWGTATAGATIRVYLDSELVRTVIADGNGDWTISPNRLDLTTYGGATVYATAQLEGCEVSEFSNIVVINTL